MVQFNATTRKGMSDMLGPPTAYLSDIGNSFGWGHWSKTSGMFRIFLRAPLINRVGSAGA